MRAGSWPAVLAVLAAGLVPAAAPGQELARRVAAVDDGTVRLTYPARPGVQICDEGIRLGEHNVLWHAGRGDGAGNCRTGPVEVELHLRSGAVRGVELIRRKADRTGSALDLGSVPAGEAARFLLEVARRGGSAGRGEEDAVLPAVLADVQGLWRELLSLARDRTVEEDARTSALFWVSQEAADAVTEGLADVALDDDQNQEVREAAVFALSQRPNDEAVPILMEIARTARDGDTRRSAMFWLAQSEDERVFAFFEEVLLRGGG